MWKYNLQLILAMLYLLTHTCTGLELIDVPNSQEQNTHSKVVLRRNVTPKTKSATAGNSQRQSTRHWLFRQSDIQPEGSSEEEKDLNIKKKIATLVEQTIHDTTRKIISIQHLKEKHREEPPYRIGFILSMIKKARDVLNELFNVAVKHREAWKALEQLKIFELVVHTNVDTTNLVRQLVEIHIQHLNATHTSSSDKRRVVLL